MTPINRSALGPSQGSHLRLESLGKQWENFRCAIVYWRIISYICVFSCFFQPFKHFVSTVWIISYLFLLKAWSASTFQPCTVPQRTRNAATHLHPPVVSPLLPPPPHPEGDDDSFCYEPLSLNGNDMTMGVWWCGYDHNYNNPDDIPANYSMYIYISYSMYWEMLEHRKIALYIEKRWKKHRMSLVQHVSNLLAQRTTSQL